VTNGDPQTTRPSWRTRLRALDPAHWIALAAALLLLPALGATELHGGWEQLHAGIAQRMAADGPASAFAPARGDDVYLERPSPAYWLGALATRVFGANSFAARLPSALAGILLVWTVVVLVRRVRGPRAAALAAGVTATVPLAALLFRTALPAALPVALSSVAFLALAVGAADETAPRRIGWLGWALLGAAFGVGGVPVAVPPLAALLLFALFAGRRPAWGSLDPLRGALLAVAVAAPLVVPSFVLHGPAAARGLVRPDIAEESPVSDEQLEATKPDDRMGFDADLEALAWGAFPWSALLPAAVLGLALRRRRTEAPDGAAAPENGAERGRAFDLACLLWLAAAFGTTALLGDRWHHDPYGSLVPLGVVVGLYLARKVEGEWSPVDAILLLAGLGLLLVTWRDLGGGTRLARLSDYLASGGTPTMRGLAWPLRIAALGAGGTLLAAAAARRWWWWLAAALVAVSLGWTLVVVHGLAPAMA